MPTLPKLAGLDGVEQRALISILTELLKRQALDHELFRRMRRPLWLFQGHDPVCTAMARWCRSLNHWVR